MINSPAVWEAPAVEQVVARMVALRPAYTSILAFYGPVFVAQRRAAAETSPAAIEIDEALLEMKSQEGFSLLEPAAFPIDLPAAGKLLVEICHIAVASGEKLRGAGEALLKAIDDGLGLGDCFIDVLGGKRRIHTLAGQLQATGEMLSLLFYLAAAPSVEKGARQLAGRLSDQAKDRGSCPVCGSAPILGELDPDGKRWLHCGLCWHRWPVGRTICPFCDHRDSASLDYLYSDDEPEYRVSLCGNCRRYVKEVDRRRMDRDFFPPLEQVASLHLDLLVADRGYRHAVASEADRPTPSPTAG